MSSQRSNSTGQRAALEAVANRAALYKRLAVIAAAVIAVHDISILDSDGDRSKAVIVFHLEDGTDRRLVVPKSRLSEPQLVDEILHSDVLRAVQDQ